MRVLAMFPYESVWASEIYFSLDRDASMGAFQEKLAYGFHIDNKQAFCIETDQSFVFVLFHDNLVHFSKSVLLRCNVKEIKWAEVSKHEKEYVLTQIRRAE